MTGRHDRRDWWPAARSLCGVGILAVVVWRFGTGPFLAGLRSVDGAMLALAAVIGAVTTVAGAWRWRLVAGGLGMTLPLRVAITASYRSQFLNTTLPGGVLGDVHRGIRHGRQMEDVGRGLRAVGWERVAGQVVFIALALVVLLVVPSPVRGWMGPAALILLAIGIGAAGFVALTVAGRRVSGSGTGRWDRAVRMVSGDVRQGLLAASVWPTVVLASVVVVVGHLAIFYAAVRGTGTAASAGALLPVAVLVLLAMVVPLNVGGWGPREGMAAWAFGAAGFGAAQGVAAATVYGVLALVATLPGAVVLVADVLAHRGRRPERSAMSGPATVSGPAVAGPASVLGASGASGEKDAVRG